MLMKALWLIFTLLTIQAVQSAPQSILSIYGEDDRKNFSDAKPDTQKFFKSIGVIADNRSLKSYPALATTVSEKFSVCKSEKYSQDLTVGECTGFLISPNKFLTAAHCIKDRYSFCSKHKIIFNFTDKFIQQTSFAKYIFGTQLVECSKVHLHPSEDVALLELKSAINAPALSMAERLPKAVFSIGSPLGVPLKMTNSNYIEEVDQYEFLTQTDTFNGSSGSPVFDASTSKVAGILTEGENDFSYDKKFKCFRYRKCTENNCSGERVLKYSAFKGWLKSF